ncbi:SDH family Clp fold serine proteinase [Halarsenatibacter silvermanii]|uniref:Serine protease, ClpP class n=1 Tax=Halarsenatibacter silvermanii TaxID=321763 RepID=A0A1G9NX06_9FIRM|nr:ATP-dependent Clp protease proteolytic subunit [Halarsenatibacter silvermanii]SDL91136.1 serine protease, ClpP class [Halarsenatibacter silvermanii]
MSWSLIILVLILLFFVIIPLIKNKIIRHKRIKKMKSIEEQRDSRVITLIHRQEILGLIGMPFTRFINIEDSEEILRAVRETDSDKPIDLILHTPGGLVLAAEQIARAIDRHPAPVKVLIPHYAMSGGTLIALAADNIIMDQNAVLGPVDPQISGYPAASIKNVLDRKDINEVDDDTLIKADIAEKAVIQLENFLEGILADDFEPGEIEKITKNLSRGKFTHDFALTCDVLQELNIDHHTDLPDGIYELMKLYPQPGQGYPSVNYLSY